MRSAWVAEIFDSIQGEGIYAGVRQIFIRFSGCNLRRCDYCDSRFSWKRQEYCINKLQITDCKSLRPSFQRARPRPIVLIGRERLKLKNPISSKDIVAVLKEYLTFNFSAPYSGARSRPDINRGGQPSTFHYHSISLTGGEPLLQADFLKELIPDLKGLGFRIYLETNGTLPAALRGIIKNVDFVAMDIKFPSATGRRDLWEKHRRFLRAAGNRVFVKVVVTGRTTAREIEKAALLVAGVDRKIPLVIQPASGQRHKDLFEFQRIAGHSLEDVRIIPQFHKILGIN